MENEKSGRPKGSLSLRRFRCAERRWRASPLRSTAAGIGGVRSRVDSQDTLLQQRVINQENKGHWVTPLLAQRYPLPGNGYFWRAAAGRNCGGERRISVIGQNRAKWVQPGGKLERAEGT